MAYSRLCTPARKFFNCQLLCCCRDDASRWTFHPRTAAGSDRVLYFSQVWLQGIVVLVSADGNNILLDDGTAIVHATGVKKIVKNVSFCKGMYIMIAGQLTAVGTGIQTYSFIEVLKIADLSEDLNCEAMWMLEVLDVQLLEESDEQAIKYSQSS